jgi:hypothetical protein
MKKLNGFNNGRDTTEGIGGKPEPFEELTPEERGMLSHIGINVEKWFMVCYKESKEPLAIFKYEDWANEWK